MLAEKIPERHDIFIDFSFHVFDKKAIEIIQKVSSKRILMAIELNPLSFKVGIDLLLHLQRKMRNTRKRSILYNKMRFAGATFGAEVEKKR